MKNQFYITTLNGIRPDKAVTIVKEDGITGYRNKAGTVFTDRLDTPEGMTLFTNSPDIYEREKGARAVAFVPFYDYPARNVPASEIDAESSAIAIASKVRYDAIEEYMEDGAMVGRLSAYLTAEDKKVAVLRKLTTTGKPARDKLLNDWISYLVDNTGDRVEVISNDVHHVVYTETMFCDLEAQRRRAIVDVPLMTTTLFVNPSIVMPDESIEQHSALFDMLVDSGIVSTRAGHEGRMTVMTPTALTERMSMANTFDISIAVMMDGLDSDEALATFKKRINGE